MVQSCCFQKVKAKRDKCSETQGSLGRNKPGPQPRKEGGGCCPDRRDLQDPILHSHSVQWVTLPHTGESLGSLQGERRNVLSKTS